MPAGDEEIFATAVDRGTHPAFAGGAELSRDLELVALLRAGGPELAPRPDERARARAAVFARLGAVDDPSDHVDVPGTERDRPDGDLLRTTALFDAAVDEPEPVPEPGPADELARLRRTRGARRHAMPSRRADGDAARRPPIGGRIVVVAAAAVLGTAVLGGAGALASRNALPGEGLYPIKRAAESAGLAMTWDETERGRRHLDLASTRIDEVEQLLAKDGTEMDPEVFRAGLQEFDSEADAGHRLLLADEESRAAAEAEWQAWAADHAARLAALRGDLPGPAASNAAGSLERLEQLGGPAESGDGCRSGACAGTDPGTGTGAGAGGTSATGIAPADATGPGRTRTPPTGQPASGGRSDDGGQQGGDQAPLLPGLLPEEPLGGVLGGSDDEGSGGSGSAGSSSDDQGDDPDGSDGSGSSDDSDVLPPLEVPPLVPGLPGVSIG